MLKTMVGIDIGRNMVKIVLMNGEKIQKLAAVPLPENDSEEDSVWFTGGISEILKGLADNQQICGKNCALVLPAEIALTRRLTMPYMTVSQLKTNLPYEFRDYIQKDKNLYFYDYAVVGIQSDSAGKKQSMDLMVSAVQKKIIDDCRTMLSKAGFRLVTAVPEPLAYRNLIRYFEKKNPDNHPVEYCIMDLGHHAIRMHMFIGDVYETTRQIEYGGAFLDTRIAEMLNVDRQTASRYKEENHEDILSSDVCQNLYGRISIEVMRAINFYGYNNPESDLQDIYIGGALAKAQPLIDTLRADLALQVHSIADLMPEMENDEDLVLYSAAVGITLQ